MAHTDKTQNRGDLSAYDRYLRGMNTSMRQKVALTAAHLLGQGKVADMGMGSGLGSHALASLYPSLHVVGVDLDPTMVTLAKDTYRMPNLEFVVGNIAKSVFDPESLDGIFNSSVLHHVTSYGGYRYANASEALEAQVGQLGTGGVLIVRDFLAPPDQAVWLGLPTDDGDETDDPATCSTASLFERFTGEFKSLAETRGFSFTALGKTPGRAAWRRYQLSLRHATEFILRKDYRSDWVSEVREEYGYFTQDEFESHFARLGLRVLASTPIRNPWILRNRWEGRCALHDLEGKALTFPATNYLIVGERVPHGEGVSFRHVAEAEPLGFLHMAHYRHRETGEVFDLVRRPFPTLDVLPFFEAEQGLFVLARMSYPRPLLGTLPNSEPTLDERRPSGYVTEPLTVIQTDQPMGFTVEALLKERAGLEPSQLRAIMDGTIYYPSPGGILEEVRSVLVQTDPVFVLDHLAHASGFSTSGRVRAIEARQLLRAAQVGGLSDARLELNVYELLLQRGERFGDWIGESIILETIEQPPTVELMEDLLKAPRRRAFVPVEASDSVPFLDLHCGRFEELDAKGQVVATRALEYVVPRLASTNTLAIAFLYRQEGRTYFGVEDRDLPAVQGFTGNSNLLAVPAWRLPPTIDSMPMAKSWVRDQASLELGIEIGELWELGGAYHPTPGLTPESVYPLVAEVRQVSNLPGRIHWVSIDDLIRHREHLKDGHLRILLMRVAHAIAE